MRTSCLVTYVLHSSLTSTSSFLLISFSSRSFCVLILANCHRYLLKILDNRIFYDFVVIERKKTNTFSNSCVLKNVIKFKVLQISPMQYLYFEYIPRLSRFGISAYFSSFSMLKKWKKVKLNNNYIIKISISYTNAFFRNYKCIISKEICCKMTHVH